MGYIIKYFDYDFNVLSAKKVLSGFNDKCAVMSYKTNCIMLGKGLFNYVLFSRETILILVNLGYDLTQWDTIKLIKGDINIHNQVKNIWNNLYEKFNGDVKKILEHILNNPLENVLIKEKSASNEKDDEQQLIEKKSTSNDKDDKQNLIEEKSISNDRDDKQHLDEEKKAANNKNDLQQLINTDGAIILNGMEKQLIIHKNKLIFQVKRGGLLGTMNKMTGTASSEVYLNKIRSITVFEGSGAATFLAAAFGKSSDIQRTISYLKVEIEGVNNQNNKGLEQDNPYAIRISIDNIPNAHKAKEIIETQIEQQNNKSQVNNQSFSIANELKKYAELRDQGILTEEEFVTKKKELLNL